MVAFSLHAPQTLVGVEWVWFWVAKNCNRIFVLHPRQKQLDDTINLEYKRGSFIELPTLAENPNPCISRRVQSASHLSDLFVFVYWYMCERCYSMRSYIEYKKKCSFGSNIWLVDWYTQYTWWSSFNNTSAYIICFSYILSIASMYMYINVTLVDGISIKYISVLMDQMGFCVGMLAPPHINPYFMEIPLWMDIL